MFQYPDKFSRIVLTLLAGHRHTIPHHVNDPITEIRATIRPLEGLSLSFSMEQGCHIAEQFYCLVVIFDNLDLDGMLLKDS